MENSNANANVTTDNLNVGTGNATDNNANSNVSDNKPSYEEIVAQLEAEKAERVRQKAALDKALKEKGEVTKQLRQKMTVEETEAEEKRIADEKKQAEYDSAIAELNHLKATNAYTSTLSDEKTIENLISAIADGDHKTVALIIENEKKAAVKSAEAVWLKNRPQINVGNKYSGMTREQIMAISDREERQKAIALNKQLF